MGGGSQKTALDLRNIWGGGKGQVARAGNRKRLEERVWGGGSPAPWLKLRERLVRGEDARGRRGAAGCLKPAEERLQGREG